MAAKHLPVAISSFAESLADDQSAGLVREFLQHTAADHAALLQRAAAWLKQQVHMPL